MQAGGPQLVVGTIGPKTVRSAAAWAEGLAGITLDLDLDKESALFDVARQAWQEADKPAPHLATSFWFALGDGDEPRAQVHRSSCTPLHCAAMGGHMTVAMRLLEARPGLISIKDTKGKTPAWWAARRGHTVLAATLRALEAKAADAKAAGAGSSLSNGSATVKKYQVAPTAEES